MRPCDCCCTNESTHSCYGCYSEICSTCVEPGTADAHTGRAMCRDCAGYALEGIA